MISSVNTKESPVTDKNALKTLVAEIQDKNANMEEDLEFDTNDINELAVLLRILLIFPNEYFEKNERTLLVYIASLMDIWCVANTQIDVLARSKISLTCKNLNLQFINFFSINSILGFDSSILAWLITSSHQLASESSEACKNTPVVLKKLSDELEKSVLRKILAFAGAKLSDKHATQYLKNATQQCVTSTKEYIAIGLPTESANLLNSLASFLSTRKISADTDLSSVIYATDTIIPVSNQVIGALKDTKQDVASILEQVKKDKQGIQTDLVLQYTSKFESAKRALYLTRLLHGYARTLGNSANKVIPMKELSGSLMELASPIIQLLQSTLDDSTKTIVCSLSTEYIAALCSMPMGDQHVKASKHILATFWFIYSLMHNIGDVVSIELLSNTFVSWIKNSSREQFDLVIIGFVEQAEEQAANRDSIEKEKHHLIFIQLLSLLFSASTEYQKAKLKRHIPVFIIKITLIAGKINSLKFLQMMLSLLDQLTVDESYRLSSFDLSLVLSCLIQVARPDVQKLKSQINRQFAHDLFTDICHILSNLMRHYKEQMTDVMPPFIGITQSLLHCFKSGHVHLVSGLNAKKHNVDSKNTPRTITLLSDFAPLNDTAAQQYSRLLKTITQKQHSYIAGKTNRSSQSVMKAISKHTPSVLVEYFTIQSNSTMSILQPSIKSALINALYEILDLCSDDDRSFIMTCLDAPGKLLFKEFYSNWKTNHKYSGQ
ncbi:hypothetical protein G6F56_002260 [Rhizopus delemar]|nr:hypothetical protein G6F56_002260 [Rhizopus delemar]